MAAKLVATAAAAFAGLSVGVIFSLTDILVQSPVSRYVVPFGADQVAFCEPGEEIEQTNYTYDGSTPRFSTPLAAKQEIESDLRQRAHPSQIAKHISNETALRRVTEIKSP